MINPGPVSWNCRNFRILSKTARPHITALTMDEKLSSRITISDASFATEVEREKNRERGRERESEKQRGREKQRERQRERDRERER